MRQWRASTGRGCAPFARLEGMQEFNGRSIWAVGRNYGAHAKELGNEVPDSPMIFLKSGATAVAPGVVQLPDFSSDVHHEVELALRFGADFQFDAVGVALDLTARDLQNVLKEKKHPWTLAKSFRGSCPLSGFRPLQLERNQQFRVQLWINDVLRQDGHTKDLIFQPEVLREHVLRHFPVEPGDVLLTGTPSGVAKLEPGDRARARVTLNASWTVEAEWSFT